CASSGEMDVPRSCCGGRGASPREGSWEPSSSRRGPVGSVGLLDSASAGWPSVASRSRGSSVRMASASEAQVLLDAVLGQYPFAPQAIELLDVGRAVDGLQLLGLAIQLGMAVEQGLEPRVLIGVTQLVGEFGQVLTEIVFGNHGGLVMSN